MLLNKRSLWKRSICIALGVTLTCVLAGCGQKSADGPVVATYKGGEITQSEMDKEFSIQRLLVSPDYPTTNQFKGDFLKEYITLYKIIEPEAKKANVQVDKTKVDTMLQNFKQRLLQVAYQNNQQALDNQMKKLHVTDDDIRSWALDTMYIDSYRTEKVKDVKMTDDQLKKYYQDHLADFTDVTVDQILVKTEAEAKNVEAQLKAGANFSELAKKVSIDPSAKDNGGQFKDVSPSQFVEEFKNACMTLPIGQISDPVHTQYGYHIIKVEERTTFPVEQTRSKALQDMQDTAWNTYIQNAEQNADIKITLPPEKQSSGQKQPDSISPNTDTNKK